ncbi:MAG: glycoside hydrolase family 5 protein [Porphyromonas sp.]|nr:glycoside hydrolase family 5 protein [Porphyromonas sp.]
MKKYILLLILSSLFLSSCATKVETEETAPALVTIDGTDLITPEGEKLFIQGTNLGNWLNPEGYMFGFQKTNSAWMIDLMLSQLIGPDQAASFWKEFKDNYITQADINYIASTGSNTIRLPFHYKLFTDEDYMGLTSDQDGFERIDQLVEWCREAGLYLILDMHDCPGGQTGDNIDDSMGYPWLFESEESQALFCDIWQRIAERYHNEPVILGYELMNEPIAPYFDNVDELNAKLQPLYKRAVSAIREVDEHHIIILGGAQWNGNFAPLTEWEYDDKIIFSCHRYGGSPAQEAFQTLIDYRDKTNKPMFMGETGHNTMEWQSQLSQMLRANNIGYLFWPYKKVDNSCMVAVQRPEGWQTIIDFAESPRTTFKEIREARPDQDAALKVLDAYLESIRFDNCVVQTDYVASLDLQ